MRIRRAAGMMLLGVAACASAPSSGGHQSSTSSGATSSGGGVGGATTTSSTDGTGGTIVIGSGGMDAGVTCTPAATAPPGDCASKGIQILAPFAADYGCVDLGTLPTVPSPWGGFAMKTNDPLTLLITGKARTAQGRLYAVSVGRDKDCHISGFTGTSTNVAEAPYSEAGVAWGPSGVLFLSQAVVNKIGELLPGSTVTDKTVDMGALGVGATMCGLGFVPSGFPGEGRLKLTNWPTSGQWYDAPVAPDGSGTFDITAAKPVTPLPNGAGGFVFIAAGNVDFPKNTVLVSEYNSQTVVAYDLDANGDPDPTTRRPFLGGISGAQGGVLDPLSGDFLFSTFSTARIIAIRGFKPPPPPVK